MSSLFEIYFSFFAFLFFSATRVAAEVTVYTSIPLTGFPPPPEATAICISASACDGSTLTPIPLPQPGQSVNTIQIPLVTGGVPGMGGIVNGDFQGFSIELSIANSVLGNDGPKINPIFLNLMQNVVTRAGRVLVRVGGNSQETATIVPGGLPNDTAILKTNKENFTPTLLLSPSLIYAMGNSSQLVNIDWFIGLPFNDTVNIRPELAEISQAVLKEHLVGMQLSNEPDLYFNNKLRGPDYSPQNFTSEWGTVVAQYKANPLVPTTDNFVGPSVCCGQDIGWTPERVWDTGYLDQFKDDLGWISVEHYPTNNCNSSGTAFDPNALLPTMFLNHTAVSALSQPYINSANLAQQHGKPLIMFETNTASCGGFSALSDGFAAALWALDYNMNMAVNNFSNALYHVGGQRAYYNPFTPMPTNQTKFRQWTIGPTYYTALITAEAFGRNKKAQVADLGLAQGNEHTPGYVIVEDGVPQRLVLLNFYTDPSGQNNYTAYIGIGGNQTNQPQTTPSSIKVKYFIAPSVSEKWNITWGGQSFGGPFGTDGRPMGDEVIYTFACDTTNNFCPVTVPAPGAALVFLSDPAFQAGQATVTQTFATTLTSKLRNTATLPTGVLATSNGRGGQNFLGIGSTSPGKGSANAAPAVKASLVAVGVSVIAGLVMTRSMLLRS